MAFFAMRRTPVKPGGVAKGVAAVRPGDFLVVACFSTRFGDQLVLTFEENETPLLDAAKLSFDSEDVVRLYSDTASNMYAFAAVMRAHKPGLRVAVANLDRRTHVVHYLLAYPLTA